MKQMRWHYPYLSQNVSNSSVHLPSYLPDGTLQQAAVIPAARVVGLSYR
jgi:hypothetical protein